MTNTPDNAQLRQFIIAYFNETELDTFCFDYFWEVEFANSMTLTVRAKALISHCRRRDLIPQLLEKLEQERPQSFQVTFATLLQPQKISPNKTSPAPQNSFIHEKTGLEFVRIPAGDFLYGDEELKTIHLPEYWISKTPVTQQSYQKFINASPNYPVPFYDEDPVKPYNWDNQKRTFPIDKADHPMVLVSWHDAVAFSDWARLRLPTEQEWEKAARGTDGRHYPWGNDWRDSHCNTEEAGLGKTSFVGKYSPQGDSPCGCVDMSGNVWEWTASRYNSDSESRVLRGGSWFVHQGYARVGGRRYGNPTTVWNDFFGFRLVAPVSGF